VFCENIEMCLLIKHNSIFIGNPNWTM